MSGRASDLPGASGRASDLSRALALLCAVWLTLILVPPLVSPRLGGSAALLASFALATAWALADSGRQLRPRGADSARLLLGLVLGAASRPPWIAAIAGLGLALGLEPPSPPAPPSAALLAAALLAPVFEEVVYRQRLLGALRRRLGVAPAVLLSSGAFAIPHVEPWAVLGSFCVGLGLGAAMCVSGSLALCVGLHAGLNLAGWLWP